MINTIDTSILSTSSSNKPRSQKNPEKPESKSEPSVIEDQKRVNPHQQAVEDSKIKRLEDLKKPEYEKSFYELPNDMFNYKTQKSIETHDKAVLQVEAPGEESFTAEKSNQGKELDSFFSSKKFTSFAKVKKHTYIQKKPQTAEERALDYSLDDVSSAAKKQRMASRGSSASDEPGQLDAVEIQNEKNLQPDTGEQAFKTALQKLAEDKIQANEEKSKATDRSSLANDAQIDKDHLAESLKKEASAKKMAGEKDAVDLQKTEIPGVKPLTSEMKQLANEALAKNSRGSSYQGSSTDEDSIIHAAIQKSSITDKKQSDDVTANNVGTSKLQLLSNYNLQQAKYLQKRDDYELRLEAHNAAPDNPNNIIRQEIRQKLSGGEEKLDFGDKNKSPIMKMVDEKTASRNIRPSKELDTRTQWFANGEIQEMTDPNFNDKSEIRTEEIFHTRAERAQRKVEVSTQSVEDGIKKSEDKKNDEKIEPLKKEARGTDKKSEAKASEPKELENDRQEKEARKEQLLKDLAKSLSVKI